MNAEADTRPVLVVSAHAGDFVWRAGGAMALASARGAPVTVLCLSFGERGESARAWREGKQLAEIKAIRRGEAEHAAGVLGATIEFLDAGDYPLRESAELVDKIVRCYRRVEPAVVDLDRAGRVPGGLVVPGQEQLGEHDQPRPLRTSLGHQRGRRGGVGDHVAGDRDGLGGRDAEGGGGRGHGCRSTTE